MVNEGTILGTQLYSYDPNISCNISDIIFLLSNYRKIDMLKSISELSVKVFDSTEKIFEYYGIPINDTLLDYATQFTLLYARSKHIVEIPEHLFTRFLRMCFKILDSHYPTDPDEILLLTGYRQFRAQEKKLNRLARMYIILMKIWQTNNNAIKIDMNNTIKEMTGLTYQEIIIISFMIIGNKKGYFYKSDYTDNVLTKIPNNRYNINNSKFCLFYNWASVYINDVTYNNKYLNPFVLKPIIDTKLKPNNDLPEVSILPSYNYLFDKCTTGMYFQLCEYFNKGEGNNLFKVCFGYAFEDYVGYILKKGISSWCIIKEIKYKKRKQDCKTVDWIIAKDKNAVFIEVKQSSIFIKSKNNPCDKNILKDFKTTIKKAIKQLKTTTIDVNSNKYPELYELEQYNNIEYLIVINDPLYFGNTVVNKLLENEIKEFANHIHIINISDFEVLIHHQRELENLFELLKNKKNDNNRMKEFKEFIISHYPDKKYTTDYLKNTYNEIFRNSH